VEEIVKTQSIKNDYEYKRIYKKGSAFVNPFIVVYILKNKKNINRMGITTSKKIGNAVKRNRDRRIIREAVRQLEGEMKSGYDFVFVARGKTYSLKCQNLRRVLEKTLTTAGVIAKEKKKG
jgi:ribonuclease P protein component